MSSQERSVEEIAEELVGCVRSYADHKKVVAAALRAERDRAEKAEARIREMEAAEQRSCARNQGSTQFCLEAMELESRLARLRQAVVEVLGPLLKQEPNAFDYGASAVLLREATEAIEKGQP